jgi:hypothetical protein
LWNNPPKCCWFFIASCNTCKNYKKMHGTIFVQHLKKDMLATNYNYIKSSIILRCKKAPQCKFILTSYQQVHKVNDEN